MYNISECRRQVKRAKTHLRDTEILRQRHILAGLQYEASETEQWILIYDYWLTTWQKRLELAIEHAVDLWRNIMSDWTDKQLLEHGLPFDNEYQSEAADLMLRWRYEAHQREDAACPDCGKPCDNHVTVHSTVPHAHGWDPPELQCPRGSDDINF